MERPAVRGQDRDRGLTTDIAADLRKLGIAGGKSVRHGAASLSELALERREGSLSSDGVLVVRTGRYTGRVPQDKFIVREQESEGSIWWGDVNRSFDPAAFDALAGRVTAYLGDKDLFVEDCRVGADPEHAVPVRVVTDNAWHALFARNMFLSGDAAAAGSGFTLLHAPGFQADPARDRTRSEVFVVLHLSRKLILIGGTAYAGEVKKAMFTVMNYLLPGRNVLPMHCAANTDDRGEDCAIFFGLSGTGKTTLSADPARSLIGDDEHAWSDTGVFNLEGGCYAKVVDLSPANEPQISAAVRRSGSILENVICDPAGNVDFHDISITENTRASYPLSFIPGASATGMAGHPRNIFMLTCDAFGILPPIASLSPEQARRWFLAGYTAKVAGTETGVKEPKATFSPCFGGPFLPRPPAVYAQLFQDKIAHHNVRTWLVNTGWTGGPYGIGKRFALPVTRRLISAALSGELSETPTRQDPHFGFDVPLRCGDLLANLLNPREAWKDPAAYDSRARELVAMMEKSLAVL